MKICLIFTSFSIYICLTIYKIWNGKWNRRHCIAYLIIQLLQQQKNIWMIFNTKQVHCFHPSKMKREWKRSKWKLNQSLSNTCDHPNVKLCLLCFEGIQNNMVMLRLHIVIIKLKMNWIHCWNRQITHTYTGIMERRRSVLSHNTMIWLQHCPMNFSQHRFVCHIFLCFSLGWAWIRMYTKTKWMKKWRK